MTDEEWEAFDWAAMARGPVRQARRGHVYAPADAKVRAGDTARGLWLLADAQANLEQLHTGNHRGHRDHRAHPPKRPRTKGRRTVTPLTVDLSSSVLDALADAIVPG